MFDTEIDEDGWPLSPRDLTKRTKGDRDLREFMKITRLQTMPMKPGQVRLDFNDKMGKWEFRDARKYIDSSWAEECSIVVELAHDMGDDCPHLRFEDESAAMLFRLTWL